MEIRLWDTERLRYVNVGKAFLKLNTLEVYAIQSNFSYGLDLEPHFYLNGERIA